MATAPAVRGRPSADLGARRWEIFRRAAPLFTSLGYRGVTIKAIGRRASLAPASLYYYFPTKKDLALFPLGPDNDICDRIRAAIDALPPGAQLERVRVLIDHWMDQLPDVLLAVKLAGEAGFEGLAWGDARRRSELALKTLASIVMAAVPGMSEEKARELGNVLQSMLVGSQIAADATPAVLRRRLISVVRLYVTAAGIDPDRFDAAFST